MFGPFFFYLLMFLVPITSVYAAHPLFLEKIKVSELRKQMHLVLPSSPSSLFQSSNTLKLLKEQIDYNQVKHLRMQQYYQGFPVIGGYAILHTTVSAQSLLSSKNKVKMNGVVFTDLSGDLGQVPSSLIKESSKVLEAFKALYKDGDISEQVVMPIIYINDHDQAIWAYKVALLVSYTDRIPQRPTAIIDAKTKQSIHQWNDLKTQRSIVQGIGFGGNHWIGKYKYGQDFPALTMMRNDHAAICYMENKDVKVVDMAHKYAGPNRPMKFSCVMRSHQHNNAYWMGYKANGYDAQNGAYSPSNDALYAGQVIKNMYGEWFHIDVLSEDNKPKQLVMRVHYGQHYENAYWDKQQMTFGDGDEMMYPLVSLGVAAHEISHGFTEQYSNLEYFGHAGGMNEAFSDMAAQAAEYYVRGQSSWTIGAEIMKQNNGYKALRYMDMPSRDGQSIDSADQYQQDMDVHHSSGVYNRLFYLLAHRPQWDVKQAFEVMVKANMDYWTPYSDFTDGACGVMKAADDLNLPVDDVKEVLSQVAIHYENCGLL